MSLIGDSFGGADNITITNTLTFNDWEFKENPTSNGDLFLFDLANSITTMKFNAGGNVEIPSQNLLVENDITTTSGDLTCVSGSIRAQNGPGLFTRSDGSGRGIQINNDISSNITSITYNTGSLSNFRRFDMFNENQFFPDNLFVMKYDSAPTQQGIFHIFDGLDTVIGINNKTPQYDLEVGASFGSGSINVNDTYNIKGNSILSVGVIGSGDTDDVRMYDVNGLRRISIKSDTPNKELTLIDANTFPRLLIDNTQVRLNNTLNNVSMFVGFERVNFPDGISANNDWISLQLVNAQAYSSGSPAIVLLDNVINQTGLLKSSYNLLNGELTIPENGVYSVSWGLTLFRTGSNGYRSGSIVVGNFLTRIAGTSASIQGNPSQISHLSSHIVQYFPGGSYIRLEVISENNLDIYGTNPDGHSTYLIVRYLGPATTSQSWEA